ncbi:unnamed protein product [Caenorhabditis auriculariae]|uniref:Anaphase-promoting complex subunit 1 n=1 Tax=Caenorhabditis auriculariae TaxID=2777116 RepID=A0A8S1HB31_9PELO|nr:unnamed protein product [Caenorhabditis auriculariae]
MLTGAMTRGKVRKMIVSDASLFFSSQAFSRVFRLLAKCFLIMKRAAEPRNWTSTPVGAATPRSAIGLSNRQNLQRNLHERVLTRAPPPFFDDVAHSDDFVTGRPSTSTIHSSLTHVANSAQFRTPTLPKKQLCGRALGNTNLLKEFTRMIRETPRLHVVKRSGVNRMGILEQDPDVDLLLSKLCLECVFVEPASEQTSVANKIFLSRSLSQVYLNYMISASQELRVVDIGSVDAISRGNPSSDCSLMSSEVYKIPCADATFLQSDGMTVVHEFDSSISLYAGKNKVAVLCGIMPLPTPSYFRLFPCIDDSFTMLKDKSLYQIQLPPAFEWPSVGNLMRGVLRLLPLPFSQHVYGEWRASPLSSKTAPTRLQNDVRLQGSSMENALQNALKFLVAQVGISVNDEREKVEEDSPEVGGKQRRPRRAPKEVWDRMSEFLGSKTDVKMRHSPVGSSRPKSIRTVVDVAAPSVGLARQLFYALHDHLMECILHTSQHRTISVSIPYIYALAKTIGEKEYVKLYEEEFSSAITSVTVNEGIPEEVFGEGSIPPFCVLESLKKVVRKCCLHNIPLGNASSKALKVLVVTAVLVGTLKTGTELIRWLSGAWRKRLALDISQSKKVSAIIGTDAPSCQKANDLLNLFGITSNEINNYPASIRLILLKLKTDAATEMREFTLADCGFPSEAEVARIARLRWPKDSRMKNAEAMLDSFKPVLIAMNIIAPNDEANQKEHQDNFLLCTSLRYFTQSFGRAFFELRTEVPSLLKPLEVPPLALGGKVYPTRVTCDSVNTETFRLHQDWAEFYNGVAVALKVGSVDVLKLDSEWMTMSLHLQSSLPSAPCGMALGFGLNGHLANINLYGAHELLCSLDRMRSVGLLLGLAASKFASCDAQIHKILVSHLPFLMGATMLEVKVDRLVQTASISALGLLFANSGNTTLANKLINEIGRSPTAEEEPAYDRASYKLSAGFSIGLIMLGKGNEIMSSRLPFKQPIPSLTERLLTMMQGGPRDQCVFLSQPTPVLTADLSTVPPPPRSNHVKEGNKMNVHLVSQPATIALGLTFMRTGNEYVAERVGLPDSITALEQIRPDFVFSRVLSHALIMWNDIQPTESWLIKQVPNAVLRYMESTMDWNSENGIMHDEDDPLWDEIVDRQTLSQVYLYSICGALFAAALKFCSQGSDSDEQKDLILLLEKYIKIVLPHNSDKHRNLERVSRFAGESVVSVVSSSLLCSMAMVMAGSGDSETLRHARFLRMHDRIDQWLESTRKHHEQLAVHQAIGMLFMGKGRYCFKDDPLSVALLVVSFFPVLAQNIADNVHYHQPLRFLWVLAVEPRLIVPVQSLNGEVVQCDIIINIKISNSKYKKYVKTAPCLLPPLHKIASIEIGGGKYEMKRIELNTPEDLKTFEKILSVGYGRVELRRFDTILGEFEKEGRVLSPELKLDLDKVIFGVTHPREQRFRFTDRSFNDVVNELDLGSLLMSNSQNYPLLQQNFNCLKEEITNSSQSLIGVEARGLELTAEVVKNWEGEYPLSFQVSQLSKHFRNASIF